MLLTVQDLAIVALILTGIIIFIFWKLFNDDNTVIIENDDKKNKRNSRVIQFLAEKGFIYLKNINELRLNLTVDEQKSHIVAGRNIALLKKGSKRYLLKLKTSSMEGKRFNSPEIRTPLLEMQSSLNVDGIILFDKEKDRYQVFNFREKNKTRYLYLILAILVLIILILLLIILRKSGSI